MKHGLVPFISFSTDTMTGLSKIFTVSASKEQGLSREPASATKHEAFMLKNSYNVLFIFHAGTYPVFIASPKPLLWRCERLPIWTDTEIWLTMWPARHEFTRRLPTNSQPLPLGQNNWANGWNCRKYRTYCLMSSAWKRMTAMWPNCHYINKY